MRGCYSRKKPLEGACVSHLGFLSIGTGNKLRVTAHQCCHHHCILRYQDPRSLWTWECSSDGHRDPRASTGGDVRGQRPTAQLCSTSLTTAQLCSTSLTTAPLCSTSLTTAPLCSTSLMTAPLCSTSLTVQLCTGKGNTGKTSSSCTRGAAYPIKHYCSILLGNFSTSNLTDTFFKPMLSLQILMSSKSVF